MVQEFFNHWLVKLLTVLLLYNVILYTIERTFTISVLLGIQVPFLDALAKYLPKILIFMPIELFVWKIMHHFYLQPEILIAKETIRKAQEKHSPPPPPKLSWKYLHEIQNYIHLKNNHKRPQQEVEFEQLKLSLSSSGRTQQLRNPRIEWSNDECPGASCFTEQSPNHFVFNADRTEVRRDVRNWSGRTTCNLIAEVWEYS